MLRRLAVAGLRRDKPASIVLAALMAISVLLAATGAGLLGRLVGVSESLLERAEAPDVVQMHSGALEPEQIAALDAFAADQSLEAFQISGLLTLEGSQLEFDGVPQSASVQQNSLTVPTPERDRLLTLEDETLEAVEPGTIWMPVMYKAQTGLEVGGTVTVTAPDGFRLDLEIVGFVRDSLMNTALASSKRLAVSRADFDRVAEHTGAPEHLISFWLGASDGARTELAADYADAALPSDGPMLDRRAFRMFTVIGEGLVAGLVLLIAGLVAAVGALCLRLAIATALERDRQEIGVLRGIGIPRSGILRLHLLRYTLIAAPAAAVGLGGALLLEPSLSADLTLYAGGTGGAAVLVAPVLTALVLLGGLLMLVVLMLRRIGRASPAAAMREAGPAERGGTGRRRGRRRAARDEPDGAATRRPLLAHPASPASAVLALRGLRRRAGQTFLLAGVFALSMMLMIIPTGVAGTIASPRMLSSLGVGPVDVLVQLRHGGPESAARVAQAQQAVQMDPRVRALSSETVIRHEVISADGERVTLPVADGDRSALPREYTEGRAPVAPDEIALSLLALVETGASVGGTLEMRDGAGTVPLHVVGAYQDLTYGGVTGQVHRAVTATTGGAAAATDDDPAAAGRPSAEPDMRSADGLLERHQVGIALVDGVDPATFADELATRFPDLEVADAELYRDQLLGPLAAQLQRTAWIAVISSLVLAALMSAMVLRLHLAAERPQISVQQDIGIEDTFVTRRFSLQMLILLVPGAGAGAVLGTVLGQGLLNLALEAMLAGPAALFQGASRLDLDVDALVTGLVLPGLLAATVILTSILTCRTVLRFMTRKTVNPRGMEERHAA